MNGQPPTPPRGEAQPADGDGAEHAAEVQLTRASRRVDPGRVVDVADYSRDTLRSVLAHVEVSTTFSHFVYREAEMDTLLRLTTTALDAAEEDRRPNDAQRLHTLLDALVDAHNFVGEQRPHQAAQRLTDALQSAP